MNYKQTLMSWALIGAALLSGCGGGSGTTTATTSLAPTIAIDQTEPVSGLVKLSVSSDTAYSNVYWYSDLRFLGAGRGDGNSLTWNVTDSTTGPHLILAKIEVAPDSYIEVRRSIQVDNSNLVVIVSVSGSTGVINVDTRASSQYAIAKVDAVFDGVPMGSLTEPNACGLGCGTSNNVFRFTVNAADAGPGSHTMEITATDGAGRSKTTNVSVPIFNLPILTLTTPVDGAFVNGTLNVSGTSSTEPSGVVTVRLGDYEFLSTTSASFSGSMSLAGLNPGSYPLTATLSSPNGFTLVQRTVTVTSDASLTYAPNFTIGMRGELVAVDNTNPAVVLYRSDDGSYRIRNTNTNIEVTLQGTAEIPYLNSWVLDDGKAFVDGGYLGLTSAGYTDCPASCVYQWSVDGARTNLSTNNPYKMTYQEHPVAHAGYVIWANTYGATPGSYTLYDVAHGTYTKIAQPIGANYIGNSIFDFVVQNGVISFYYWAQTGGSGTSETFDVFQWSSSTNVSTKLSAGTERNIYPQTDGQTVAWLHSPTGATFSSTILSVPVAGGVVSTVSSVADEYFQLHDGLLAWTETTSGTKAIKALASGTTSTVSTLASSRLWCTGGGFVVFEESGKVYAWNAATRTSRLIIDAAPNRILLTGNTMYFVMGTSQTVYRVSLS